MKFILVILSVLLVESCGTSKQNASNAMSENDTKTEALKRITDFKSIEYSALARGSFTKITIKDNTLSTQLAHNEKPETRPLTNSEIEELATLLSEIDLKSLSDLKPPSKAHQYDGAAGATLIVETNSESYTTPTFDHGKPHTVISPLVSKLLSMIEKR
ncbi:hypothetical protein [Lacinutrix salivirga]